MKYVEEREFTLRFAVRCEFPDNYEGEGDGHRWAEAFDPIAADVVAAAIGAVRRRPGWSVRSGNRGRSPSDEVTLLVERILENPES